MPCLLHADVMFSCWRYRSQRSESHSAHSRDENERRGREKDSVGEKGRVMQGGGEKGRGSSMVKDTGGTRSD